MKKIRNIVISMLSAVIFAICVVGFIPANGSDIYIASSEDNRFLYSVNSDGTIKLKAAEGAVFSEQLSIPGSLDGRIVIAVADRGFIGEQEIKSLVIPKNVTQIGSSAFSNCYNLKSVKIEGTITEIGAYPFFATPFERTLENKNGYTILNNDILYDYTGKSADISIPSGIRVISGNLFTHLETVNNFKIKSVSIADSVEYICGGAFYGCDSIEKVVFGSGIKSIGENAFTADKMAVYGYYETCVQEFALANGFQFEPLLEYGETNSELEMDITDEFRQYYFTDEEEFSKEGITLYYRKYNGEKIIVTDWEYSAKLSALIEDSIKS